MRYLFRALQCLGWVWALPMTLVGLALSVYFKATARHWVDGVIVAMVPELSGGFVGQACGCVVMLSPKASLQTFPHELQHVRQGMILGPLIIIAYPLASLCAVLAGGEAYKDNWFERQARRVAGQKV